MNSDNKYFRFIPERRKRGQSSSMLLKMATLIPATSFAVNIWLLGIYHYDNPNIISMVRLFSNTSVNSGFLCHRLTVVNAFFSGTFLNSHRLRRKRTVVTVMATITLTIVDIYAPVHILTISIAIVKYIVHVVESIKLTNIPLEGHLFWKHRFF